MKMTGLFPLRVNARAQRIEKAPLTKSGDSADATWLRPAYANS